MNNNNNDSIITDYDELSQMIENEIHSTHSISDKLWQQLKTTVESVENINEPHNVRDKQLKSVMELNPLSFKLFQYLVSMLDYVIPEARNKVIYHVSNTILIKAFKYFPNNTEIYLAYAIRRLLNDRDSFIKSCMKDKEINAINKGTKAGNLVSYLLVVLIIGVIVSIVLKLADERINNKNKLIKLNKYDDYDMEAYKEYKKNLKKYKKTLKNK